MTDGTDKRGSGRERGDDCVLSDATSLSGGEAPDLSVDTVLDVLANQHSRFVLAILRESSNGTVDVSVLATLLSDRSDAIGSRGEAALELRHAVLPSLADAGLVDHDRQDGTVHYVGHPRVEAVLELVSSWD